MFVPRWSGLRRPVYCPYQRERMRRRKGEEEDPDADLQTDGPPESRCRSEIHTYIHNINYIHDINTLLYVNITSI